MDNFDLRKYLAEGRLLKENLVDFEGNDMYQEIKGDMKRYYKMDVSMDVIKDWADYYFPNRKDEDGIEYEFETSAREDFLDHLEDLKDSNASDEDKELQKQIDIQAKAARRITSRTRDLAMAKGLSMDDYFDSIDEGKLFEEKMSLEVDDDYIELSADSGEYDGDLNDDGTVDFSVVYDDGTEFDESNWKSILGKKHAFVKISNQIPTKVEAAGDYVMITVDLEDLKNLIKPNKSKNMKNLGSYETKDSKGNIVKRYI